MADFGADPNLPSYFFCVTAAGIYMTTRGYHEGDFGRCHLVPWSGTGLQGQGPDGHKERAALLRVYLNQNFRFLGGFFSFLLFFFFGFGIGEYLDSMT